MLFRQSCCNGRPEAPKLNFSRLIVNLKVCNCLYIETFFRHHDPFTFVAWPIPIAVASSTKVYSCWLGAASFSLHLVRDQVTYLDNEIRL